MAREEADDVEKAEEDKTPKPVADLSEQRLTDLARDAFDQVLKSVGRADAEVEEEAGDGKETD